MHPGSIFLMTIWRKHLLGPSLENPNLFHDTWDRMLTGWRIGHLKSQSSDGKVQDFGI